MNVELKKSGNHLIEMYAKLDDELKKILPTIKKYIEFNDILKMDTSKISEYLTNCDKISKELIESESEFLDKYGGGEIESLYDSRSPAPLHYKTFGQSGISDFKEMIDLLDNRIKEQGRSKIL